MRIPTRQRQRRSQGFLLQIIVFIFAAFIIGMLIYQIWKALHKIKPRQLPPDGQMSLTAAVAELTEQLQAEHPGELVTLASAELVHVPTFTLDPEPSAMIIERTTNLGCDTCWEYLATVAAGELWTDTNAPWPAAFYRRRLVP